MHALNSITVPYKVTLWGQKYHTSNCNNFSSYQGQMHALELCTRSLYMILMSSIYQAQIQEGQPIQVHSGHSRSVKMHLESTHTSAQLGQN